MSFLPKHPTEEARDTLDKLSSEEREKLVCKCVHAIMVLGQELTPIRRQDLNRLAVPNHSYRVANAVLLEANKELRHNFNMRLFEHDAKYLLVNAKLEPYGIGKGSESERAETALLFYVLMNIFTSPAEKACENDLKNLYQDLLELDSETFRNYLDNFVRKLYLTQDKTQESRTFSWGPRAVAEVHPELFFNRFLDLVGNSTAKDWPDLVIRCNKLKQIHGLT